MNDFERVVANAANAGRWSIDQPPLETRADGKTYCSVCGEMRWMDLSQYNPDLKIIVRPACSCIRKRDEEMKKRKQQQDSSRNKRDCFREMQEIERFTFCNDDRQDCNSARTLAEKYVEKFKTARTLSEVKWLILYGDPGVGKTFFAGCIANALLDAGYHVIFTSMSHIEAKLSENFNKSGLYEMLDDADLLVLDDIGSERNSSYMKEITFNIIERRKQAGKPLVVTTNIGQNDAVQKNDLGYRRIFSRLYEKSVLFQMKGNDRRKAKMLDERADRLRDLLS